MLCNLKEHCFTDNELEDDFVGIRCLNKKLQICFPLGFDISDEKELRQDVKKLISVLLEYNNMYFKNNIFNTIDESFTSTLPLMAYKHVIEYFLSRGYYTENKVI